AMCVRAEVDALELPLGRDLVIALPLQFRHDLSEGLAERGLEIMLQRWVETAGMLFPLAGEEAPELLQKLRFVEIGQRLIVRESLLFAEMVKKPMQSLVYKTAGAKRPIVRFQLL